MAFQPFDPPPPRNLGGRAIRRARRVFASWVTQAGRWFVLPVRPGEPDETPRQLAHRGYHEFITNTIRQAFWFASWAAVSIAVTIALSQGHKAGAQVLVGVATFLVCTALAFSVPEVVP